MVNFCTRRNCFLLALLGLLFSFLLLPTQASATSVTFEVRDGDGNPFPRAVGEGFFSIYCSDVTNSFSINASFNVGSFSDTRPAVADVAYFCRATTRLGYMPSVIPAVTVGSGQNVTVVITYTQLQQSLNVDLVDRNGQPFLAAQAQVSCDRFGANRTYSSNFATNTSSYALPLESGRFECNVFGITGHTVVPSSYGISIYDGVSQSAQFRVYPNDASLTINVIDSDGNPVNMTPSDQAQVSCQTELAGDVAIYQGTIASGHNSLALNVIGGQTYVCDVSSVLQFGPLQISVAVAQSENKTANVILPSKSAQLKVKLTNQNGDPVTVPVGYGSASISCTDADNAESSTASGEIAEGSSEAIVLTAPGRFNCQLSTVTGYYVRQMAGKTVFTQNGSLAEYTFILDPADSALSVNFIDENGSPLAVPSHPGPGSTFVSCISSKGEYQSAPSQGDLSVSFTVIGATTYRCTVDEFYGYLRTSASVAVGAGESKAVSLLLKPIDAEMTLSLVDQSMAPLVSPLSGFTNVFSLTQGGIYFGSDVPSGAASATIKVIGGQTYSARWWLDETPTSVGSVAVPQSGSAALQLQGLETNSTAVLRLVDSDGNVVTGLRNLQAEYESISASISHRGKVSFTNGTATLKLRGGVTYKVTYDQYEANVPVFQNLLLGASDRYFLPERTGRLRVDAGQTVTQDLAVLKANASLTVTSSLPRGDVTVSPTRANADNAIYTRLIGGANSTTFPVPAGTYYVVYSSGGGGIPLRKIVTLSAGQSANLSFDSPVADLNLAISVTASAAPSGGVICNAFAPGGYSVGNQEGLIGGGPIYIPITSSFKTWTIGCQGWSDETGRIYGGRGTYTVPDSLPQSGEGRVSVNLADKGEIFSAATTATSDSEIVLPVNAASSISVPVGTFPANKLLTLEATNKASAPETEEISPKRVLKLSAKDKDEAPVSALGPVQLTIKLAAGQEVYTYTTTSGYTRLNKTNGAQSLGIGIKDESTYTLQVPADAFNSGVIAIVGEDASATPTPEPKPGVTDKPPTKPTKLGVSSKRDGSKRSVTVTWKKVSGTVTSYSVSLVKNGHILKTISVKADKDQRATFTGLRPGTYIVRVRAFNPSGGGGAEARQIIVR